jgi:hypothetical protein
MACRPAGFGLIRPTGADDISLFRTPAAFSTFFSRDRAAPECSNANLQRAAQKLCVNLARRK